MWRLRSMTALTVRHLSSEIAMTPGQALETDFLLTCLDNQYKSKNLTTLDRKARQKLVALKYPHQMEEYWLTLPKSTRYSASVALDFLSSIAQIDTVVKPHSSLTSDQLERIVKKNVDRIDPGEVIKAISCFVKFDSDLDVMRTLLNQTLWLMPQSNLSFALKCFLHLTDASSTVMREKVIIMAKTQLEERISELKAPKHILSLLYKQDDLDSGFKATLLDHAVSRVGEMNNKELYKLFNLLSKSNTRHPALLWAASRCIRQQQPEVTTSQLAIMLSNLINLSFRDVALCDYIADAILEMETGNESAQLLCSFMTSFARLRYRSVAALDNVGQRLALKLDQLTPAQLANLLVAFATLDYVPPGMDCNFDKIGDVTKPFSNFIITFYAEQLAETKLKPTPHLWLQYVYSRAVLGRLTPMLAEDVLSLPFFANIKSASSDEAFLKKLRLINFEAQLCLEAYGGPTLLFDVAKDPISKDDDPKALRPAVLAALGAIAPSPKYVIANTRSEKGNHIDLELKVDNKSGNPKVVELDGDVTSDQEKVALMVLDFNRTILGEPNLPCGPVKASIRHLQKQGYRVETVDYSEFNAKGAAKRTQLLSQRILKISET